MFPTKDNLTICFAHAGPPDARAFRVPQDRHQELPDLVLRHLVKAHSEADVVVASGHVEERPIRMRRS